MEERPKKCFKETRELTYKARHLSHLIDKYNILFIIHLALPSSIFNLSHDYETSRCFKVLLPKCHTNLTTSI